MNADEYEDVQEAAADLAATELGVARIIAALRAARSGSQTYDVLPELFDDVDDASTGRSER